VTRAPEPLVSPLISESAIADRVRVLGAQIRNDYLNRDLVVISVLKGSFVFAADLVRAIDLPMRLEFFGVRSYGAATVSSGEVQITLDLARPITGADVLVIEDIVDTGLTLTYILEQLRARGPRSVNVCALLHKPSRSVKPVTVDYLGFTIEDVFVVGYGLDYAERYRNLPYVGVLEQPAKSP